MDTYKIIYKPYIVRMYNFYLIFSSSIVSFLLWLFFSWIENQTNQN